MNPAAGVMSLSCPSLPRDGVEKEISNCSDTEIGVEDGKVQA